MPTTPEPTASSEQTLNQRAPRTALRWVGAVVGVLVAGVVLGEMAGWPFLRQPLETALSRSAQVPVQLQAPVRLHLIWRPRLEVEHLQVASDVQFGVPHLLKAERLVLAWRWGDVWRWRRGEALRVQALSADTLDARLVRQADGQANWAWGADPKPKQDKQPSGLAALPSFGVLGVKQGDVSWVDAQLDADVKVRLQGSEGEAVAGQAAGYQATLGGSYRGLPLKLEVRVGGTLPLLPSASSGDDTDWVPVHVEGTVSATRVLFDGQTGPLTGMPRLQGQLEVEGPSLANVGEPLGVTLPQTPPFDLRGQLQHADGTWQLKTSRAHIGGSRLVGDLQYEQGARPARLTGRLTGPKLALADLGPAIGTRGGAATPVEGQAGRALPQRRFDLPSLRAMDADVQVAIDELDFGTTAMAPLRQLQTHLRLAGGVLRLEDLQAVVSGGQVKGMTQLDGNASPAKWEARLDFAGIDMAGWIRALQAGSATEATPAPTEAASLKRERDQARQGGDQAVQSYLTGQLFGDLHLLGEGRSTAEILGSANGPIRFSLRDGTMSYLTTELMGLDVAQALGAVIEGDRPLPLRCARFDLLARDGVVQPRLAVVDNEDSTVWIAGRVSLVDESLDLHMVTRPKDFSLLSLRTPITVTGTLSKPSVGIQPQRLAGRVLGALALGAVAGPAAAILPLIEQGSQPGADPCNPALVSASPRSSSAPNAPKAPAPAPAPAPAAAPAPHPLQPPPADTPPEMQKR